MNKNKTYHQLQSYRNYKHINLAGVLLVFGFLMLFGISDFPKNLMVSLLFFTLAYMAYQALKTTKPISIFSDHICLGKMVNGYQITNIQASSIERIDLVHEIKTEFRPAAAPIGGDVEVYSNYYLITLHDKSRIQFDNQYDELLQDALKLWCQKHHIELKLDVKKKIDG